MNRYQLKPSYSAAQAAQERLYLNHLSTLTWVEDNVHRACDQIKSDGYVLDKDSFCYLNLNNRVCVRFKFNDTTRKRHDMTITKPLTECTDFRQIEQTIRLHVEVENKSTHQMIKEYRNPAELYRGFNK